MVSWTLYPLHSTGIPQPADFETRRSLLHTRFSFVSIHVQSLIHSSTFSG